jgi:hypothetical protein
MSAKYKSPSFLLPNEINTNTNPLNTDGNPATGTGVNSLYSMSFPASTVDPITISGLTTTLKVLNTVTVSFWYYPTNFGGGDYMIKTGTATSSGIFAIERFEAAIRARWKNSTGTLQFIKTAPNTGVGSVLDAVNKWYHICVVFDTTNSTATDKVQIWVNGVRNTTGDSSLTGSGFTSTPTSNDVILNDVSQKTNKIDELAFFNKALTSTEIAALYGGTSPNIYPSNLMATNLNPIAYYPLGEQAQNTGKLPQATANVWQFPNGVLQDYVMDFDGVNDYIVGTESVVTGNSPRTISCWIKTSTQHIGNLFSLGEWSAVSSFASRFAVSTRGQYGKEIRIYTNTPTIILTYNTNIDLYNDSWYNIVVTYDGTNTYKLYINGNPEDTQTDNTTLITESGFSIGSWYNNAPTQFFNGQMSNVVVWNSDQSANIANIYNNGSPQTTYTVTPQNWWKLNADSVYMPSAPNYTTSLNLPQPLSYSNYIDFPTGGSGWSFNDGAGNDTPFTVSAWVYNTSSTSKYRLLSKNTVGTGAGGYEYAISAGGRNLLGDIEIFLYDSTSGGGSPYIGAKATLHKPNEWVHVAFTYDASAAATGLKIYANGEQLADTDVTAGTYTSMSAKNSKPNIGRTVGNVGCEGNVSNLTVFNSELTASQVSTLFNFGTPETTPSFSPTLWFKLDNTTTGIQSAGSLTGASYNGTIGGSVTATSPAGVAVIPSWKIPSALPITTTPNYTTALDFVGGTTAGSGHSIDISSYTGLSNTSAFTVSIWFKGEDFSTDWIFSTSIAGDFGSNVIGLDLNNSGQLRPNILFNGTSANISNVDIDLNKWYHAAITYDGSTGIATMYVNTVAYAGTNNLGSTTPTFSNNLAIAALEFRVASPSLGYYFDGLLSNMAIFNTALPATGSNSIEALYNNGTPLVSMSSFSSLQAWWKLDNLATGIQDSSGNGYNGSNSGATQVTSDVLAPQPVNGVSTTLPSTALQQSDLQFDSPYSNYSLKFDSGSSTSVDLGSSSIIRPTGNYTFSIWYNLSSSGNAGVWCAATDINTSGLALFKGNSGGLELYHKGTSGTSAYLSLGSASGTINIWQNAIFTYNDSIREIKGYLNGNLISTVSVAGTGSVSWANNFYLGRLIQGGSYHLNGLLDEFSIFNTPLTSAQVLEIYNNGRPKDLSTFSGTAPISWWRLGENAYFQDSTLVLPNSIIGAPNGEASTNNVEMLSADAPGTYANGVGTNLDIVDRVGDAALSVANSQSYNMIPDDKIPYVPGYVGDQISNTYSMAFDGTNYFDLGSSLDLGINNTISCWVYKTNNSSVTLIGEDTNSSNYAVWVHTTTIYYRVYSPAAYWSYSTPLNDWTHFAFTRNGSNVKFYVNGTEQTLAGQTGSISPTISTKFDTIGNKPDGSNGFVGQIDEFAAWDKELTADQIKFDLYEPSLPLSSNKTADIANNPNLPTPVAWYRMGD